MASLSGVLLYRVLVALEGPRGMEGYSTTRKQAEGLHCASGRLRHSRHLGFCTP